MKNPEAADVGQERGPGVLDSRIENGNYIVTIKWRDGKETEKHFPVVGFDVVDPVSHGHLGSIKGKKALEILQEHAAEYEYDDFSWRDFV